MKINNILVISDQQDKQQSALAHAKSLVERHGAKLHIVVFNYENVASLATNFNDERQLDIQNKILTSCQKWLDAQIAKLSLQTKSTNKVLWEKDIVGWVKKHCATQSYDLIIKTGSASKVIPSVASKQPAGLVIIGSIRRKGLKAKLMGNIAEGVLALLKTDILVIQP